MTSLEAKKRWRDANPEKIKAQRERRKAREAAMTDEQKAAAKAKAREYNQKYKAERRDDPEFRKKARLRARKYYRLTRGIPVDAELHDARRKYATDEERNAALKARKRLEWAKRHGTTVEEIDARKAARQAAKIAKAERAKEDAAKRAECAAQRAQRKAEAKAAAERAKRRAAPVVVPSKAKGPPAPVNANDPPELVELFRKASKGDPVRPFTPGGRRVSVFSLRGVR